MMSPGPKHAPRVPFALLVLGLLVGGMIALLALNTASAANEVRRHDLAAKDASISATLEQLHNQVAASQAPNNLARIAAQIGMVPAGHPAFLQINPDGSVSLLGSPSAASAPPVQAASSPHPKKTPTPHSTKTPTRPAGTGKTTGTSAAKSTSAHKTPPTTPTPTATTTLPGGTR
jgi:hypothetical protein